MSVAALVGSMVPLILERFRIDPAVATGPFVTTSIDIVSVYCYFMIAQNAAGNLRQGTMADFSTDAILLRKVEYGDHDYIINFMTRSHGKICVIAKNAKQSVKRFNGALDLFSANRIGCAFPKKNRDGLLILTQADLENGFGNIRSSILKTAYASFWAELTHFWLEEGKSQSNLYDLLYYAMDMPGPVRHKTPGAESAVSDPVHEHGRVYPGF